MNVGESFFVDPAAGSVSTVQAPTLGHVERRCNQCHHPWELGQEHCRCGSHVFDEIIVPPSLIERVAGKIVGVPIPEKVKVKPLDPADVMVLEHIATTARAYAAALQAGSDVARRVVNETPSAAMVFLQDRLNAVAGAGGDFSAQSMTGSWVVPTLGVANLVEQQIRGHAEEVTAK